MKKLFAAFLILACFCHAGMAGPKHEDVFSEDPFYANLDKEKSEKRSRKSLFLSCRNMEHSALIYGKNYRNNYSERFCKGSDDQKYHVNIYSIAASALHVCKEDIFIKLLRVPMNRSAVGTWYGGGFVGALGFELGGYVMGKKNGSIAVVLTAGCGVGVLLGSAKLSIKNYDDK